MITTQKFVRKPLYVDAVRITQANFDQVAEWCQGEIRTDEKGKGSRRRFIHVRVHNPQNQRQSMAFTGDWLLYTERGYKVYTNKAFNLAFDLAEGFADLVQQARETGQDVLAAPEEPTLDSPWTGDEAGPIISDANLHSTSLVAEEPSSETGVQPILGVDVAQDQDATAVEDYSETHTVGGTPREEINLGAEVTSDEWEPGDVREGVIAEQILQPESPEMAEARATIEAEGGTVEEATPQAIADVVVEQEKARVAAEASGKRVLSEKEQREMDPDEVRDLLQSGDVILAQDLAA